MVSVVVTASLNVSVTFIASGSLYAPSAVVDVTSTVGSVVSTLNTCDCTASTLWAPRASTALSSEDHSNVCVPSAGLISTVNGVHAPPSQRYSVPPARQPLLPPTLSSQDRVI